MTSDDGLTALTDEISAFLAPLLSVADGTSTLPELLTTAGWNLGAISSSAVATVEHLATDSAIVFAGLSELTDGGSADQLAEILDRTNALVADVRDLGDVLSMVAPDLASAAEDLAGNLLELLSLTFLMRSHPTLYQSLTLLTVVDSPPRPDGADAGWTATPAPLAHPLGELHLARLGDLLRTPVETLHAYYVGDRMATTAGAAEVADRLFPRLAALLSAAGLDAQYGRPNDLQLPVGVDPTIADHLLLLRFPVSAQVAGGLVLGLAARDQSVSGLVLRPFGSVRSGWPLTRFEVEVEVGGAAGVVIVGDGVTFPANGARLAIAARVRDTAAAPIVLGAVNGTHLEFVRPYVELGGSFATASVDYGVVLGVRELALIIQAGESDGFLSTVLPREPIRIAAEIGIGWSRARGVTFRGGSGLAFDLPLGLHLGPIILEAIHVALEATDGAIRAQIGAQITLALGPFAASVAGFGMTVVLGTAGTGPDLRVGLKPPSGVGLAIDSPAVRGGGFLEFDDVAGRYLGVFELTIVNTVSVKVIAIITTRLADGSPGFALLLIITAEGFTPIQLGMGFALTGVGGLLALNRSIDVDAVRDGLKSGVLDSVLFVKDPVNNAPRILSTLDRVFPLAPDRFLVGPLAEISWGPAGLVKIRLALLLEVPQPVRVVLLAAIGVTLPDPKAPVVELHVDAIGVLDFGRGELALDASLHDSRIMKFTLTGDMALRLNWGSAPSFLMSVGGFHPRFTPPAGLRPLNRLTLTLTDGENPRIRFQMYLAVTSNTIQMGARVEVYAVFGGFGIDGGGAFDALVQWSPFAIDVSFEAWVRIFGPTGTLLAARVAIAVTGPEPWHVTGVAEVTFLGLSARVPVDLTIGGRTEPPSLEAVDVAQLLWDEAAQRSAWDAALPADQAPGVTLGQPAPDGGKTGTAPLVVHPLSRLTLRQKVVPLGTPISRVGARLPAEGRRSYEFDVVTAAGLQVEPVNELFAPAQYTDLPDDEKLTGAAFVPMPAGLSMRPNTEAVAASEGAIATDVVFELRSMTALGQPGVAGPRVPAVAETAVHGAPAADAESDPSRTRATWAVVAG